MTIHYEEDDHIALVTIDRPERRNAMDEAAYAQLSAAWCRACDTPSVRVAVITGVGSSFCAGADLASLIPRAAARARGDEAGTMEDDFAVDGSQAVLRQFDIGKPIVAAVNGHCVASGTEMLLGTDIRIAAENAFFGLPEVARVACSRAAGARFGSPARSRGSTPWTSC